MFDNNLTELCFLYCLSPLHAGAGQATGAVDLPIQRERHTAWPHVQSSGVKGAFRHWFYAFQKQNGEEDKALKLTTTVFGGEETGESDAGQAGAISFSDARLLAFPVRSNIAPFVWVTCPAVLDRLNHDLLMISKQSPIKTNPPQNEKCFVLVDNDKTIDSSKSVILEDLCVDVMPSTEQNSVVASFFTKFAPRITRLILLSDADYSYLVRTSTEIQPQIKIDMSTGTTVKGSLRYQELLPADSLLYSIVFFFNEKKDDSPALARSIRDYVMDAVSTHIQLGGDATLGRGLMEISWKSASSRLGGVK